jgi:hypothetical protein
MSLSSEPKHQELVKSFSNFLSKKSYTSRFDMWGTDTSYIEVKVGEVNYEVTMDNNSDVTLVVDKPSLVKGTTVARIFIKNNKINKLYDIKNLNKTLTEKERIDLDIFVKELVFFLKPNSIKAILED